MTIEQVKSFLEFEDKPVVDLYLEIVNLTKIESKQIEYLRNGLTIKEISALDNIEPRTADERRRQACEKLVRAWSGRASIIAISNYVIQRKKEALN